MKHKNSELKKQFLQQLLNAKNEKDKTILNKILGCVKHI